MKALLILLLVLIIGTLIHYHNTTTHPIYSRETYLFKEKLDKIIEEVNSTPGTWVAGRNEMFDHMVNINIFYFSVF